MSKLSDAFVPEQGSSSRSLLPGLACYQKSRAGLLFGSFASTVGDLEHRLPPIREGMQALVEAFMREVPRGRLALCPLLRKDPGTPFAPPKIIAIYWYTWCGAPNPKEGEDGTELKRFKRYEGGSLSPSFLHELGLDAFAPIIQDMDARRERLKRAYRAVTGTLDYLRKRLTRHRWDGKGAFPGPAPALPLLRPGLSGCLPRASLRILDRAWEQLLELAADEYALHLLVERTRRAAPWPGYRIVHLEDRTRPWGKFVWETFGRRLVRRAPKRGTPGRPREALTDKILRSFGVPERGRKAILAVEVERRPLSRRHEAVSRKFREMEKRGRGDFYTDFVSAKG